MTKKEWDEELRKIDEQYEFETWVTRIVFAFALVVVIYTAWQQ